MAEKQSRGEHVLAGDKKKTKKSGKKKSDKKGKKAHRIHIRKAANGGFIAENHYKAEAGGQMPEMEEHSIPDLDQLHQHIDEHMSPDEEQEEAAEHAGPAQAPPAGAMGV